MKKVVGRPKKKDSGKLTEFVSIRFSQSELMKVEQKADNLNISRSEYFRNCALDNLSCIPAFRAIPQLIKEEFSLIRKQVNFLRVCQIKLAEGDNLIIEIDQIIVELHKIVAKTEMIVSEEVENQHIGLIASILKDFEQLIEDEVIAKEKLVKLKIKIEKILNEKTVFFKI
jgi:hypothetical protein